MTRRVAPADVVRRALDITAAVAGLTLLSPLLLAAALAVRVRMGGPVLFRQRRLGLGGTPFELLKLRSMHHPAPGKEAPEFDHLRLGRLGRLLRSTSIDELPSLLNLLRGQITLVGPRPHAVAAQAHNLLFNEVVDGYFARHRVKPGVTGWAQINGWRGEVDNDEKIQRRTEFDLYYIENWSLLFDLKILFLTPIRLLKTENAY